MDSKKLAVAETKRLLTEIRDGFGNSPIASRDTFARFQKTMAQAGKVSKSAAPPAPLKTEKPQLVPASDASLDEVWETLRKNALSCTKCPNLVRSRTQVVFGVGNRNADLMFVGEAPGADEDKEGEPFVGRAGQLLTKIIEAMGFTRDSVYIGNVLKCRPDMPEGESGNRKPRPEEMDTCLPWLKQQIALIKPKALVALGATAAEGLLKTTAPMRDLRGRWHEFEEIPVMVTYHPAYLLRNQSLTEKRKVWEDMLLVLQKLQIPITEKQQNFFKSAKQ
ncbi:MAG: uracil-DNA glycosylase [Chthoniobacterales bacterium]